MLILWEILNDVLSTNNVFKGCEVFEYFIQISHFKNAMLSTYRDKKQLNYFTFPYAKVYLNIKPPNMNLKICLKAYNS